MILGLHSGLWIGIVDGLVDANNPQEIVLDDTKIQQEAVCAPCNATNNGSGDGVQDEMIRSCHDGCEDQCWVRQTENRYGSPLP